MVDGPADDVAAVAEAEAGDGIEAGVIVAPEFETFENPRARELRLDERVTFWRAQVAPRKHLEIAVAQRHAAIPRHPLRPRRR